jgi:hypothetical protein
LEGLDVGAQLNIGFAYAPTLQVVEQFYTENGIPVEDDENWVGLDPMELVTAGAADKWHIQQGQKSIRLNFNREPRFYGSVSFHKGTFFGSGRYTTDTNPWIINMIMLGGNLEKGSATGYLCKKMINLISSHSNSALTTYRYAFPVIRLADLYLMYAEALNEVGGPGEEAYAYIDTVRIRTGLEKVVDSWNNHAIASQKGKPATKAGLRDIIRRERLNELAFEGARFWDLRRWKLAEEYMNKPVRGFVNETVNEVYPLKFEQKDYFWPIRTNVLVKNENLVQNPGW